MGREKHFNINVKPRDFLVDVHDLSSDAGFAYVKFWMHHALLGEPLPPRDVKKPRDEWDRWFRDLLGMKNVRSWINARDELLRLGKIKQAEDGRLYIGRTMRDVERKRGGDPAKWGSDDDDPQGRLCLEGVHCSQLKRDKSVDDAEELPTSTEVRANIGQTSSDVRPILLPKSLIRLESRCVSSSPIRFNHEVVAAIPFAAARARGDPASLRP